VLLGRAGFDCHTAESGRTAFSPIDRVEPDIAILDVGLPELEGFEVARRFRKNPKFTNIVLIALTGYGCASDRAASREAGFEEHLVKPIQADQLLSVLADMQDASAQSCMHE
jgi:DNA-binding response OmpR family regulator